MKKKILSVALAAIFSLGIASFAQSAQNTDTICIKKECKKDGKCDKKGKKFDKKDRKFDKKQKEVNLFEGLNLTEEQQQAIAVIPTPQQVMKTARDNNKVKADTANFNREERKMFARQVRAKYLDQVKAVLTPDQYVQFLENYFTNASPAKKDIKKDGKRQGDNKQGMKGKKDRKDRRDGKRHASNRQQMRGNNQQAN